MIRSGDLAMDEIPFDPKRRLCPDGACVGVLGADGRCSVCQRPAGASAAWASGGDSDASDAEASESSASDSDDADASTSTSPTASGLSASEVSSGFDANRRLCDDGSCVGIVGADGICGTCGKKAE
jgi:hypothetical protein